MNKLITALALIAVIQNAHSVEIYFSPGLDCENKIVAAIDGAKTEVVAAVYSIGNERIAHALQAAHKRGVNVKVLTDRVQAAGRGSKVMDMIAAGVNVRVHSKHRIEHNKYGVFDGKLAINGSYNWTRPASSENSENCAVMPEPNAIAAYKKRFDELWTLNSQEKSAAYIARLKAKNTGRIPASKKESE